jgi:hypothetical protein
MTQLPTSTNEPPAEASEASLQAGDYESLSLLEVEQMTSVELQWFLVERRRRYLQAAGRPDDTVPGGVSQRCC